MTRSIGLLIFPDFQLLDAAGPIAVFDTAARESSPPSYRLRVMANTPGPVTSSSGAQLVAETFSDQPLDTFIVAGGWGAREVSTCPQTLAYVRAASGRARRTASVCSGAFILAAAGLLDGHIVSDTGRRPSSTGQTPASANGQVTRPSGDRQPGKERPLP